MKNLILPILIAVILSAGINYIIIVGKTDNNKSGWISLTDVFNDFAFKKELEMKLKKTKDIRQAIVDSLEFDLKFLSKQIVAEGQKDKDKISIFELKKEDYLRKKQQFEADNDAMAKQYDSQIVSQMNQYIKDFGKQHGYRYIFGADGSGFLMYSLESDDITKEVKAFINEKYKGKTE